MEKALDLREAIAPRSSAAVQPVSEIPDDTLRVEAARDGDRAAFGQLYERYARVVHGVLLTRVPPADVDDLVHDVFLLALRRLHTLRASEAFGGWLVAIARNRAHDHHRRARPLEDISEDLPNERSEDVEAWKVLALIRDLPEAYRETLILRLVEGLNGPEIAARTGLTPGSVRVNLHRGMRQLREKLGKRNEP